MTVLRGYDEKVRTNKDGGEGRGRRFHRLLPGNVVADSDLGIS